MIYQGIGASAGIGIGRAVLLREDDLSYSHVIPSAPESEKVRLRSALDLCAARTTAMAESMKEKVGKHQADILNGQAMMLSDPFMLSQMEEQIDTGLCAEAAADAVYQSFIAMFSVMEDELMRQRATDIGDLRTRLLGILLGREAQDLSALPPGSVLVIHDLTPSMTTGLNAENVAGILTEAGGVTSHSAILARAMALPAVLSVAGITQSIRDGDTLVVDGGEGVALVNPDGDTLQRYEERQEAMRIEKADLDQYRNRPTATADGISADLYANIGSFQDAGTAVACSAEGIGLFRTEFLFMDRAALPSEEEQFQVYKDVAEKLGGREVIIRTLDVGGDKDIPYLGLEREENPFLGFRAIRYCLDRQDVFRTQLRALLRASVFGGIKIMLPLVTTVAEVRNAKALLSSLKAELNAEGIPYRDDVKVGIMIETPAAALIADLLAKEVDFFSIGTNDLTQYTMAVDRGNSKVAYLYSPLDPAVLRSIRDIIRTGREASISVGMCGEAAADPLMVPLLLSFGLDEYSVGAGAILSTRKLLSKWTKAEADAVTEGAMALPTEVEVRTYMRTHKK